MTMLDRTSPKLLNSKEFLYYDLHAYALFGASYCVYTKLTQASSRLGFGAPVRSRLLFTDKWLARECRSIQELSNVCSNDGTHVGCHLPAKSTLDLTEPLESLSVPPTIPVPEICRSAFHFVSNVLHRRISSWFTSPSTLCIILSCCHAQQTIKRYQQVACMCGSIGIMHARYSLRTHI